MPFLKLELVGGGEVVFNMTTVACVLPDANDAARCFLHLQGITVCCHVKMGPLDCVNTIGRALDKWMQMQSQLATKQIALPGVR